MYQSWSRLLFLHWRFPSNLIQELLPKGLAVDTFDGSAWVGLVPFEMRRIRPRGFPSVPYVSNFLELNLRTYAVDENGLPGVWFVSLSANRKIAVDVARWWFGLPYYWSGMSRRVDGDGWFDDRCRRFRDLQRRTCRFRFRPYGEPIEAVIGTLDYFLVERYFLFSDRTRLGLATGQVYHPRYLIQPVEIQVCDPCLFLLDGLPMPATPPDHMAFSPGVDVAVFGLRPVTPSSRVESSLRESPS